MAPRTRRSGRRFAAWVRARFLNHRREEVVVHGPRRGQLRTERWRATIGAAGLLRHRQRVELPEDAAPQVTERAVEARISASSWPTRA